MKYLFSLICFLLFSACQNVKVAENVSQYEAHKIVAELNSQGISSVYEVSSGGREQYNVLVRNADRLPAIALINNAGLLPKPDSNFSELTKSGGFLPNSRAVENLRLDRALAVELEDALLAHPEITQAKVVVRVNNLPEGEDPSVSVVLSSKTQKLPEQKIRELLINSVPGVKKENISVLFEGKKFSGSTFQTTGLLNNSGELLTVSLVPFLFWKVPAGADYELSIAALVILIFTLLLGFVIGYLLRRKKIDTSLLSLPASNIDDALGIEESAGMDETDE